MALTHLLDTSVLTRLNHPTVRSAVEPLAAVAVGGAEDESAGGHGPARALRPDPQAAEDDGGDGAGRVVESL